MVVYVDSSVRPTHVRLHYRTAVLQCSLACDRGVEWGGGGGGHISS